MSVRSRYHAEALTDVGAFFAELRALGSGAIATPFQTPLWLESWYRHIAPANDAHALPVVVRDREQGGVAALLALAVRSDYGLRSIEFADFGVTDYNAPILTATAPTDQAGALELFEAVRAVLPRADILRFEKQPIVVQGRPNPLALLPAARPSSLFGNVVVVESTAEEFVRQRGRKYRKEVERCFRLLEARGARTFAVAGAEEEAIGLYRVLEQQQAARMLALGKPYMLDAPAYSRFYEEVLRRGVESRQARIFCLGSKDAPVALIYGIADGRTFLLLRISNAGEAWSQCSPGRLVIVETIHHLRQEGITHFDMTIGDYAFKRGFSPERLALCDLHIALSPRGIISVGRERAKAFVRGRPGLEELARRLLGRPVSEPGRSAASTKN